MCIIMKNYYIGNFFIELRLLTINNERKELSLIFS